MRESVRPYHHPRGSVDKTFGLIMQLIRGLHNLKIQTQSSIVTIGNFDGMHLGHQHILQQMIAQATTHHLQTVVVIFEPQPKEYFMQPQEAPLRLMRLREKIIALKEQGIDKVLCLYFNAELANLSPEQFVNTILVQKLYTRFLWVGEDFKFGRQRQGDVHLLRQFGERYQFQVVPAPMLQSQGEKISSTRIRTLIQQGHMEEASTLLGHPLYLSGKVMQGEKRGRTIGFPTANINLPHYRGALSGVYAVRVSIGKKPKSADECESKLLEPIYGVANIGKRPTFAGSHIVLEVHLFDFNQDIYDQPIRVEFMHKLRDEQRFSGLDALKQQIAKDTQEAKEHFKIAKQTN